MKSLVKYLSAVLVLLCIAASSIYAQDSVKVLFVDDCIKIALNQSAQILLSQNSVQISGASLIGAYGQFLPDLNFNSNYGYLRGNDLYTTEVPTLIYANETQLTYQLSSTVNIFNGFSDYSALKAATLSKSASQFNLDRDRQQITFDVTQTFLQVILDRRIVDYANKNLEASEKRESQLQELTNVGRRAISDLYQQQAETSSDKLFKIQSENKLKNDIILLLRKLKISQTDNYRIGDMIVDTVPFGSAYQNVETLVDTAINQRPDLKSAALAVKIADWQIEGYKSGYLPKLYLQGGLVSNGGYFTQLYVNGADELGPQEPYGKALFGQVYGEVALSLSWHIFDRLYNKTNVT